MGRNKDEIIDTELDVTVEVNVPDGVTSMDENEQAIILDDVLEDTNISENKKEEEMLTVEEPIKQENIVEKSFVDVTQNAKLKYLHVGMKFLVGKLSNEEQRNFYLNFPELR